MRMLGRTRTLLSEGPERGSKEAADPGLALGFLSLCPICNRGVDGMTLEGGAALCP